MPAANLEKDVVETILAQTKDKLSKAAVILTAADGAEAFKTVPQWSDFDREIPAAIVRPATEDDVQVFVSTFIKNKIAFKAHGGGHSNFSTIASPGVMLDTGLMRKVTVDKSAETAVVEAGCTNSELAQAVFKEGFATTIGTCDDVGVIGLSLGGGVGPLQGLYGCVADQIVSARIVTGASGELVTVSQTENPDLFFAIRGAGGVGFGVIASITMKIHPIASLGDPEGKVWFCYSHFSEADVPSVLTKILELNHDENDRLESNCIAGCFPPDFKPGLHVFNQIHGDVALKDSFISQIFEVAKPVHHEARHVIWTKSNEASAPFGELGGYKAMLGTGITKIRDAAVMFSEYVELTKSGPDSARAIILLESHPRKALLAKGEDFNAYPHRKVNTWINPVTWYAKPELKDANLKWLKSVRAAVSAPQGRPNSYMNFRFGDESPEHLFTNSSWPEKKKKERLDKLRSIKRKYDPVEVYGENIF